MKLIIAGSRTLVLSQSRITAELERAGWKPTCIISGCARGPDTAALDWAEDRGIPVERHPADWSRHGKAAGPLRNREMAQAGDALLLFWDGASRGSASMLREMERLGKPVRVVR